MTGEPKRSAAKSARATPAPRARYHHGDLPRALRAASLEVLAEVGPEAFTLREAARRAGVNHRAVYRHFEDKRALLVELAEEGYRGLADDMARAIAEHPEGDAERRLVALAEGYLRFARREPARYHLMFGSRLNADGRFPQLEEAVKMALAVLRAELRAAAPTCTSLERRDAGVTLWATIHGLTDLVLAGRVALSERRQAAYVDTVMRPPVVGVLAGLRAAAPRA